MKRQLHSKYKTQKCTNFWNIGHCPYGSRCRFIHNEAAPFDSKPSSNWCEYDHLSQSTILLASGNDDTSDDDISSVSTCDSTVPTNYEAEGFEKIMVNHSLSQYTPNNSMTSRSCVFDLMLDGNLGRDETIVRSETTWASRLLIFRSLSKAGELL